MRVSTKIRVLYGVGATANAVRTKLFGLFALYYYTSLMGLPGTLVGIVGAISLLWDAIIDPIIGDLSDNSRGRLGKRHGLMLLGSVTMGLAFWAFFSPPEDLPTWALFIWALVTGLWVRTATSMFVIPYYALGAELTTDYHERTSVVAVRSMFAFISILVTTVLSFALFFPSNMQQDPQLTIEGYRAMAIFAGLIMTASGLVATIGTLGERQYARPETKLLSPSSSVRRLTRDILNVFRIRSFRIVFGYLFLCFIGIVINATLSIHFFNYYVGIRSGPSLALVHLSGYIGAVCGVVFWTHFGKGVEKRTLCFLGTMATAIIMSGGYFFFGEGNFFGTGNLYAFTLINGMSGIFWSVLWIIPPSMMADVVDEDDVQTGQRQEGAIFGLFSFGEQIAAGGAIMITGVLIDVFANLQPGEINQSTATIERIGMLFGLLPALLLIAASFFILRYTITEEKVVAYQRRLRDR